VTIEAAPRQYLWVVIVADGKRLNWRIDRSSRLEVLPSGSGFIVVIGPAFFWLDRDAAEDLMCFLADALESGDPLATLPRGSN
jgi:hypothetical protein